MKAVIETRALPIATSLLGTVAEIVMGQAPPGGDCNKDGRGTVFVKAGEFHDRFPLVCEWTTRPLKLAKPSDVLVCVVGATAGKINQAIDCAIGRSVAAVRPSSNLMTEYLYHFLATRVHHLREKSQGLAQGVITREMLIKLSIPLPPLAAQRRIVEVLDRAETLRAKRLATLAQLDTFTQSLFLDLFGDPCPNEKSWPLKSLKELGKVKTGGTPPSAKPGMFGGPIPFVTPGDLESEEPVKRTLTEAGAIEAETVRAGATLVCCIGATIGKMGKATQHSAFNQQLNGVEWTSSVDDDYGLGVLRFFRPQIARWGAATTLPILKKSSFEKIEIPVPPLPLQREFARRVRAVEKLKTVQRASLAEMDALFGSLQHRAFRGEL